MFLVRALRAVFESLWAVLQPALRFFAWVFAVAATFAIIRDWSQPLQRDDGREGGRSLAEQLSVLAPDNYAGFVSRMEASPVASWIWDPWLATVFAAPMWLSFSAFAALLFFLSRQRKRVTVFAN